MLVGLTVDSMRLADVFVALEGLRRQPVGDAQRIMTLGPGASGCLEVYAAILDPGVHQVMLVNPPSTHADAPIFLNILRHTDLPEATALLAPLHGHCRSRRRPLRSQVRARILIGRLKEGDILQTRRPVWFLRRHSGDWAAA